MALYAPYTSKVGIQTGQNPGAAASYRGPDAFASSDDKMIPQALGDLSRGVGAVGAAVYEREMQKLDLDLLNTSLKAKKDYEAWLDNYEQNHQGESAFHAEQAYMDFNNEYTSKMLEPYANNKRALQVLLQGTGGTILSGQNRARDYSKQQFKVYEEQTFNGLQAQLSSQIANDPANAVNYIEAQANNFKIKYSTAPKVWVNSNIDNIRLNGAKQSFQAFLAAGDPVSATRVFTQTYLARPTAAGNEVGALSAQYESNKGGSKAIGWDSKGGTSYGTYQIATKTGTFGSFLSWLKSNGHEDVAKELNESGSPDTGGRGGATPSTWKRLVDEGRLSKKMEHDFIKATHYDPAFSNIQDKGLKQMIAGSKTLQDVVWSTAVQHGGSGAARILNAAYKEDMPADEFIESVYAHRTANFRNNPYRKSASSRFKREQNDALNMYAAETNGPVETPIATSAPSNLVASLGAELSSDAAPSSDEDNNEQAATESDMLAPKTANELKALSTSGQAQSDNEYMQGLRQQGFAYGGLLPLADAVQMKRQLDQFQDQVIQSEYEAIVTKYQSWDMNGSLSEEVLLEDEDFQKLSYDEQISWLRISRSEASGRTQQIQKDAEEGAEARKSALKQEAEKAFYSAAETRAIRNRSDVYAWLQKDEDRYYNIFNRADIDKFIGYVEKEAGRINEQVKQFMELRPDDFNKPNNKVIFRTKALEFATKRQIGADNEKLIELMENLATDNNYLKSDFTPSLKLLNPSEIRGKLVDEAIQQAGLPVTPRNRNRAEEMIKLGLSSIHDVPAGDAQLWRGKGKVTLTNVRRRLFKMSSIFEDMGASYNIDPDFLIAIAEIGSKGDKFASNQLVPKGRGIMQLHDDVAVKYGLTSDSEKYDPKRNIQAASAFLADLLKANNKDYMDALNSYLIGFPKEEKARFTKEFTRIYNNNDGMMDMGPMVDERYAIKRYKLPEYISNDELAELAEGL